MTLVVSNLTQNKDLLKKVIIKMNYTNYSKHLNDLITKEVIKY